MPGHGTPGVPQRVAEGVWAVAAPIPPGGPPYTLAYLLLGSDGDVHVVDPGWDWPDALDSLSAALAALGSDLARVRAVAVTHHHPDHIGLAERLRELTGARVALGAVERRVLARASAAGPSEGESLARLRRWGVPDERRAELLAAAAAAPGRTPDLEPDALLVDGSVLDLGGHRLEVIATPGHTEGHLCFVDADRGLLYTGDHVLPGINPGLGLGWVSGDREPVADYLDSLERLARYDELLVLPGHESVFSDLGSRRRALAGHHLRRMREVLGLAGELGDAPVWPVAERMTWTGGWEGLRGPLLFSALAQAEGHLRLAREGRAAQLLARFG